MDNVRVSKILVSVYIHVCVEGGRALGVRLKLVESKESVHL